MSPSPGVPPFRGSLGEMSEIISIAETINKQCHEFQMH